MKSTSSFIPSFWVKVCPVILMFITIGFTSAQAQTYKPLNEAVAAVTGALEDLEHSTFVKATVGMAPSGQTNNVSSAPVQTTPGQEADTQKKVFETSYFQLFNEQAKLNGDVSLAVQALDAMFTNQPASRAAIVLAARADLMELITL
jgi:hypothetical protein